MSSIESLDRRTSLTAPSRAGSRPGTRRTVAVIGGGVTGLMVARRLADSGTRVVLCERESSVGGQLAAVTVAGRTVDVGAESMFTAAPGPLRLIEELGLDDDLVAANPATTWIRTRRGLRALPAGFTPAGPTRLWPLARSGVLSPRGLLRAGLEPLLPATPTDDVSVGHYLDSRFGRQVTDRLLDPLLGGLHSGDVRRLSLTAATPQLAALATERRSLLLRPRPPTRSGPSFVTLRGGMRSLANHLAASLEDVEVHLDTQVTALRRIDGRTQLTLDGDRHFAVDGVVLATPAHAAAQVVREASPTAAAELELLRAASVAVAAFAYPASAAAAVPAIAQGSGLLVPSSHGGLLKAATFLSTKWPHHGDDEVVLIRASAGRIGDERARDLDDTELTTRLDAELRAATGMTEAPLDVAVQRWPATMPQLEVGHQLRLSTITHALADDLPGVVVAGAPYAGPGLASCLRSAEQAAAQVATTLERSA